MKNQAKDVMKLTSFFNQSALESLSMTFTAEGKRKMFFHSFHVILYPQINHTKIETCLLLFTANTNILILLNRELKTDTEKVFRFLPFAVNVNLNLSIISTKHRIPIKYSRT